jgi:gliding motility-associated-like protein
MSRSLVLSFQSASAKYSRLNKKIKKSITRGEFYRFTRRKRNHLLARIEKLKKRLTELRMQIRLASAGIAAAAIFSATTAQAQIPVPFGSKVGPFIKNELKNPLPGPPFDFSTGYTEVQYHDFDNDGDLDAIVTAGYVVRNDQTTYRPRTYYRNIGTATDARFEFVNDGDIFQSSLPGPDYSENAGHQTYADLDDDGDLDAIAAVRQTQTNPSPDPIFLYVNEPQENGDPYFVDYVLPEGQETGPLDGISVVGHGWPSLADIDKDGDFDLVLAGYYFNATDDERAFVQVFRNDKVGHASGVFPTFTRLNGQAENPLYVTSEDMDWTAINFADLDEDGDQDFVYTPVFGGVLGSTSYRRNDNGVFTEQEGEWNFNGSQSTGNPFNSILNEIAVNVAYRSITFGDLDGDGDMDATIGLSDPLNTSASAQYPFRYLENTGHGVFDFGDSPIIGNAFGREVTSTMFDYDGDGHLDIITLGSTFIGTACEGSFCQEQRFVSEKIFLYADGKFSEDPIVVELPEGVYPYDNYVQLIDIEGDGDLDIVSSVYTDGPSGTYFWRNEGDGSFTELTGADNPLEFINDNAEELNQPRPLAADLNNDGLVDIIVTSKYRGPQFYKNTGTKESPVYEREADWTEPNDGTSAFDPSMASVVDMDGDGDYDIIVSKYGGDVWYFQNQGTKEEPNFVFYSTGEVGKDGDPVNPEFWEGNPFAFFNNERMGNFNLADIDGDGDKDLFFGDNYTGTFKLYENQNPSPNVDLGGGSTTLTFTKNTALTLFTDVSIEDPDNDAIVKVVATVTPHKAGTEKLQLTGTFSLFTSNWVDSTGTLTITPLEGETAGTGDWADVLDGLQYTFTGDASAGGRKKNSKATEQEVTKTITVKTLDSDLTEAPSNTSTFNVSGDDGGNKAPIINAPRKTAASGGNIAFYISQIAEDLDGEVVLESAQVTSDKGVVVFGSDHDLVTIDYSQDKTYQGTDEIFVSVCDNLGACSNTTFSVEIKADILIFTGMSPNNDQVNDWFHIDYLPEGTHVAIYNRWGDLIYEENNYNVDDAARRFEGKNKNGTEVIAGTYYYKVKYPGGSAKTGYILLNR